MGWTSLHGQLTISVLTELGFGRPAAVLAAEANEAVDVAENQGNDAALANLHAMRGFLDGRGGRMSMRARRMQSEDEARRAVNALLEAAQEECLTHLRAGRFAEALERLGAALHTVQDREYHRLEPWPFDGVGDAFLNPRRGAAYGLAPDYMFAHGLRDFGYVNGLLSVGLTAFDYSVGYQTGSGWSTSGRLEFTQVSPNPVVPHLSLGVAGRTNGPFGDELVGYGLLTWGRIPARPEAGAVPPRRESRPLTIERGAAVSPLASEGANSQVAARRATLEFVNTLSRQADTDGWEQLKSYRPGMPMTK